MFFCTYYVVINGHHVVIYVYPCLPQAIPPHKLSEDEVQQLDQDCMERFIKLRVKHITDGQVPITYSLLT